MSPQSTLFVFLFTPFLQGRWQTPQLYVAEATDDKPSHWCGSHMSAIVRWDPFVSFIFFPTYPVLDLVKTTTVDDS